MSEVKKYDMDQTGCDIEDPDGVWVRASDFDALRAENERLAAELEAERDQAREWLQEHYQLRAELAARPTQEAYDLSCAALWKHRDELAALKAVPDGVEVVGVVCVSRFRNSPAMENVEFQQAADIPQGQHPLMTVAQHNAIVASLRQPVAGEREAFQAGVKAASDHVKALIDDYDRRHGSTDPDTGTREYPGNGEEWVGQMYELIEDFTGIVAPSEYALSAPAAGQDVGALVDLLRESYTEFLAIKAAIGFRGNTIALIGRIDAALSAHKAGGDS